MELHHLHVLERDANAQRHGHAVPRAGVGVGSPDVEPARPARREDDRLRPDRLEPAVEKIPGDHTLAAVVVHHELPGEELLVRRNLPLHHLLVEDVDQNMARDVCRVRRARGAGGAKGSLGDAPVLRPGEDGSPVLELVDVPGRLVAEDLDRVLVAEVVGPLNGVVGVGLGIVLGGVSERRVDPALGRSGVATDGMDLGEQRDVGARIVRFDGRAHARAARTDDEDVVLGFH